MTNAEPMRGVIAPVLTPFADGRIAHDLYIAHCRRVLEEDAHALAPFGTTGEATSVTVSERIAALEALVRAGLPPERLMPGTGLCALSDSVMLTRHAASLGCAAVMVLPPFFYVNASEDGLTRYFSELIEAVAMPGLRICLYHIPPMAGIGFSPELAARLAKMYPETVIALKDSSGDFANTEAVIAAAPELAVFPGSETYMLEGLRAGGRGCISATCNVNVVRIRAVYERAVSGDDDGLDQANAAMIRVRKAFEARGPIPAMKALLAHKTGDSRWLNLRAPFLDADRELGPHFAEIIETGDA